LRNPQAGGYSPSEQAGIINDFSDLCVNSAILNSNSKSKKQGENVVRFELAYESENITTKHNEPLLCALVKITRHTKAEQ
jgi:hypothetical protein